MSEQKLNLILKMVTKLETENRQNRSIMNDIYKKLKRIESGGAK